MVDVRAGVYCQPKKGKAISGDRVGLWRDEGMTLACVIDGLGSGSAAAEAAEKALSCIAENRTCPPIEIVPRCHNVLRTTRGAVMALVRIEYDQRQLTFVGVGNIGFSAASRQPIWPFSPDGLVGHRLPTLQEFKFTCSPGDLVVLYSDGVSSRFLRQGGASALTPTDPQEIAQQIAKKFGEKDHDVAIVALKIAKS